MPTPFPGMDPYLEHPGLWHEVHNTLITALQWDLAPRLRPRYYVATEQRTYLVHPEELIFVGQPDVMVVRDRPVRGAGPAALPKTPAGVSVIEVPMPVEIRETYLEVRDVAEGKVVTAMELLSYSNKRRGKDREQYEQKRLDILGTRTHLVEVDLLRTEEPMPMYKADRVGDYRILVSRAERRPRAELYTFGVEEAIPRFALPLRKGDAEPEVDLGAILHTLYDRSGYDMRINYKRDAVPPLREEARAWADERLRAAAVR